PRSLARAAAPAKRSNTSHTGILRANGVYSFGGRVRSGSVGCAVEPEFDPALNRTGEDRDATEDTTTAARPADHEEGGVRLRRRAGAAAAGRGVVAQRRPEPPPEPCPPWWDPEAWAARMRISRATGLWLRGASAWSTRWSSRTCPRTSCSSWC